MEKERLVKHRQTERGGWDAGESMCERDRDRGRQRDRQSSRKRARERSVREREREEREVSESEVRGGREEANDRQTDRQTD